jgi:hypothetical protein
MKLRTLMLAAVLAASSNLAFAAPRRQYGSCPRARLGLDRERPRTAHRKPARGMYSFPLPFPIAPITLSLLRHPRLDADLTHRWLRGCVREVCAEQRA